MFYYWLSSGNYEGKKLLTTMNHITDKNTATEALRQLEKINQEMRAISALAVLNDGMINNHNDSKVKEHYNNIIRYNAKYEKLKDSLSLYDMLEFEGLQMPLWNGKEGNVIAWEFAFMPAFNQLTRYFNS